MDNMTGLLARVSFQFDLIPWSVSLTVTDQTPLNRWPVCDPQLSILSAWSADVAPSAVFRHTMRKIILTSIFNNFLKEEKKRSGLHRDVGWLIFWTQPWTSRWAECHSSPCRYGRDPSYDYGGWAGNLPDCTIGQIISNISCP